MAIGDLKISVRLTEEERRALVEAAQRENRSVSRFLIHHGIEAAQKQEQGLAGVLGPK